MSLMKPRFKYALILLLVVLSFNLFGQKIDSVASSNFSKDITDSLITLKAENVKLNEKNKLLLAQSEQSVDFASKIIDWSAMLFAFLTLILIIAGIVGLSEFSNIRKIEEEMKAINSQMKEEIKSIKNIKQSVEEELARQRDNIQRDSKNFLQIVYLLNEGMTSYHSGELSKAISAFLKVKKINPNDYEATCHLARSYVGQGKYELALENAKLATGLVDQPYVAYYIMGEVYRRMHEYDLAIEALRNSLNIKKNTPILNGLGFTYLKKGDYNRAIQIFRESLDIKRTSSGICGLGKSLLKNNLLEEAKAYFTETIIIAKEEIAKSSYVYPYHNLAFSYFVLNNRKDCITIINKSFEVSKNPAIIEETIFDFNLMKDEKGVPQDLLKECLILFNKAIVDTKQLV